MVWFHATRLSLACTIIPSIPFKRSASLSSSSTSINKASAMTLLLAAPFTAKHICPKESKTTAWQHKGSAPNSSPYLDQRHPLRHLQCLVSSFYSAAFAPSQCFFLRRVCSSPSFLKGSSDPPPSHTCISKVLHPWSIFHILHPSSISSMQSSKSLLPSIVTRAFFRIRTPMAHCWWEPSPAGFHLQLLKPATTHWCFLAMVAAEDSRQTKAPPAFCRKVRSLSYTHLPSIRVPLHGHEYVLQHLRAT